MPSTTRRKVLWRHVTGYRGEFDGLKLKFRGLAKGVLDRQAEVFDIDADEMWSETVGHRTGQSEVIERRSYSKHRYRPGAPGHAKGALRS
jgi:hypothetical protein